MLDFNDAVPMKVPPATAPALDRDAVRAALLANLESVLCTLFPAGKKRRGNFYIGDILGSPGDSLEVVLSGEKAGLWTDRATGDGGDIFDLLAAYLRVDVTQDFPKVLQYAGDLVGRAPAAPPRKAKKEAPVDDLGPATAKWDYLDAEGKLIAVVYRYDPPGGKKQFRPWDAKRRKMAPPDPRPLYNQPGMVAAEHGCPGRRREVRPGADRRRHLRDDGDARRQRARRQDRLVATGRKAGADLAGQGQTWLGVRRPGRAGGPAGGRNRLRHPVPAGGQARRLGCGRCPQRRLRRRRLARRWRAPAGHSRGRRRTPTRSLRRGRLEDGGRARHRLHQPLWRRLALLRCLGQVAGLDRRALESRSGALRRAPRPRHLSGGIAPGPCPEAAAKLASRSTIAAVEKIACSDPTHAATSEEWDADVWALNTPAGVVDLRSGRLRPHRREDRMTKIATAAPKAPVRAGSPSSHDVTGGDAELIAYLQRMVGYCLTGVTSAHALFFLYGTGANGKSVFVNVLTTILGDYAANAPMDTFMETRGDRHPTDLAGLRGARFVSSIETEQGRRWNESKVKAITGGDKVSARFMRQDFFEYTPQFKLVIAGNHKPSIRNVDEAMRRRLHLIPFTVTIPPDKRDGKLTEKLLLERNGILAWAVRGMSRLAAGRPPAASGGDGGDRGVLRGGGRRRRVPGRRVLQVGYGPRGHRRDLPALARTRRAARRIHRHQSLAGAAIDQPRLRPHPPARRSQGHRRLGPTAQGFRRSPAIRRCLKQPW